MTASFIAGFSGPAQHQSGELAAGDDSRPLAADGRLCGQCEGGHAVLVAASRVLGALGDVWAGEQGPDADLLAPLWVVFSPVRQLRRQPSPAQGMATITSVL
jgi:hypothetical protein